MTFTIGQRVECSCGCEKTGFITDVSCQHDDYAEVSVRFDDGEHSPVHVESLSVTSDPVEFSEELFAL